MSLIDGQPDQAVLDLSSEFRFELVRTTRQFYEKADKIGIDNSTVIALAILEILSGAIMVALSNEVTKDELMKITEMTWDTLAPRIQNSAKEIDKIRTLVNNLPATEAMEVLRMLSGADGSTSPDKSKLN